jgi:hypothetical protein
LRDVYSYDGRRKLLEARRTTKEFNDDRNKYNEVKDKFLELVNVWVGKEHQLEKSYLDRLDGGIKKMEKRAHQCIKDSIEPTLYGHGLGLVKYERIDENFKRSAGSSGAGNQSKVLVLVVKSTARAEEFLRISQERLHTLLNEESQGYVSVVRKVAEDARGKRFNELKIEIAKLDPKLQPGLREEITQDLENQSINIRQVAFNRIKEEVNCSAIDEDLY